MQAKKKGKIIVLKSKYPEYTDNLFFVIFAIGKEFRQVGRLPGNTLKNEYVIT
jgi:hypothetical protein